MHPTWYGTAALLLAGSLIAAKPSLKDGDKPPHERLLQGDDAGKAAALQKRLDEREAADDYAAALQAAEELLTLRRRAQGADHHEVVSQRYAVEVLQRVAALPAEQRAAWRRAVKGEREAGLLIERGRYADALPLLRQLRDQRRRLLGDDHPDTAASHTYIGYVLQLQGQYDQAEPLLRRALEIYQKALGEGHPETATGYSNLAMNLHVRGRQAEAEPLFRKALEIKRGAQGEDHADTAQGYNNLAFSLGEQGRHAESEPLSHHALQIRRKVLGEDHALTANSYNNLAFDLQSQGKYLQAEPLVRQGLAIRQKVLGEEHPAAAVSYITLAFNLYEQGRHAQAEPLFDRSLAIRKKALGEEHPHTASSYNGVAMNLHAQKRYAEAELVFRRALEIYQSQLGEGHPDTARSRGNLAQCLDAQGQHARAEPLHRRALDGSLKALGKGHLDTAICYSKLAFNLDAQGKHAEAEPLFRKALEIRQRAGGDPLQTGTSFNDLAYNLYAQGKYVEAAEAWEHSARAAEAARLLAGGGLDRALFTAAHGSPYPALAAARVRVGRPADAWQALEAYLGRGLLDELADRQPRPLRADEEQRRTELSRQLARLGPKVLALVALKDPGEDDRKRLDQVLKERAAAEAALAELAVIVSQREIAALAGVQQQLPADTALLAWLDLAETGGRIQEHWACVVRRTGDPAWVQLPGTGPGGAWDKDDASLPDRLGAQLHDPATRPALAEALYAQRLKPVEAHLAGIRHLVVLPAGAMSTVPIEALSQRWTVSYAPSATVFARLAANRPQRSGSPALLALGDPAFGPAEPALVAATRGRDYKALPGTRREVEAVAALFPEATRLLGEDASQQRLEELATHGELKRYRYLHFATHGAIDRGQASRSALVLSQTNLPEPLAQARAGKRVYDGRLSVQDILNGWQLDADMVTLSACETGLGQQAGGDGLMGFAQALLSRGARGLVVSLWPVDDTATALLMVRFYENLLGRRAGLEKPLPRTEALREAKIWLRNLTDKELDAETARLPRVRGNERTKSVAGKSARPFEHPYYWSAFILIGDPN